jgi:hypothetical protein
VLIQGACTYGGGFFRRACGGSPAGQCVYCGGPFCAAHGEHGADYHEVCVRTGCQAKYRDVQQHRDWIIAHRHANRGGRCADDGCDQPMEHMCERCRLRYCRDHLRLKQVIEQKGDRKQRRTLLLCPHCRERRRIWD